MCTQLLQNTLLNEQASTSHLYLFTSCHSRLFPETFGLLQNSVSLKRMVINRLYCHCPLWLYTFFFWVRWKLSNLFCDLVKRRVIQGQIRVSYSLFFNVYFCLNFMVAQSRITKVKWLQIMLIISQHQIGWWLSLSQQKVNLMKNGALGCHGHSQLHKRVLAHSWIDSSPALISPLVAQPPPQIFNNQYGTGINQSAQRAWTIIWCGRFWKPPVGQT